MRFATLTFYAASTFTMGSLIYILLMSNLGTLLALASGATIIEWMQTGALVVAFGGPLSFGVMAISTLAEGAAGRSVDQDASRMAARVAIAVLIVLGILGLVAFGGR